MIRHIKKLIRRMINNAVSDIHTSMPAQVISYDAATNLVSIQPVINIIRSDDPDNDVIQMPVLEDIPCKQFGSGKCLLTIAPQAGSYGVFHVSERSIENWIVEGGIVNPSSIKRFDISDGFFDPGVYPIMADGDNGLIVPPINTDRIELRTRLGTTFISVVDDGTIEITTPTTATIEAAKVVLNTETDSAALASKIDTLWLKLDTIFRTAWTPAPPDGGTALKAAYLAAFLAPPTTVASTKLKLDA